MAANGQPFATEAGHGPLLRNVSTNSEGDVVTLYFDTVLDEGSPLDGEAIPFNAPAGTAPAAITVESAQITGNGAPLQLSRAIKPGEFGSVTLAAGAGLRDLAHNPALAAPGFAYREPAQARRQRRDRQRREGTNPPRKPDPHLRRPLLRDPRFARLIMFDTGSHMERFIARGGPFHPFTGKGLFDERRSDDKRPEPEGVTTDITDMRRWPL